MSPRRILFFQHCSTLGGASWSLLQLIRALDLARYRPIVALTEPGALARALEDAGCPVIFHRHLLSFGNATHVPRLGAPLPPALGNFLIRRAVAAASHMIREVRPDIVHINSSALTHLALGVRANPAPLIVVHNREYWPYHPFDYRSVWRDRALALPLVRVINISPYGAARFAPGRPFYLAPNWPDFTGRDGPLDLRGHYGLDAQRRIILAPTVRSPIKGLHVAIAAMASGRLADALLLAPGGAAPPTSRASRAGRRTLGWLGLRTYGDRMDHQASSTGNVRLVPPLMPMRAALEQSTMLLAPFVTPHFSKAIIEAGACGLPAIASDNGFNRETIRDGETGLLVEPGDPLALADAVRRLLDAPDLARRLGANAREWVNSRFTKALALQGIEQAYAPASL